MPVPISSLIGGGGNSVLSTPVQIARTISGSFTAPKTGKYLITAIGGGGSGSSERGGGAGGMAQTLVSLSAGDVISFVVGAGGLS